MLWKVLVPMVTSPLAGLLLGFLVMGLLYLILRNARPTKVNRFFGVAQMFSAASMGVMHGTNDAQKTMGIITGVLVTTGFLKSFEVPIWVILSAHAAIGLGTMCGGWRIIHTMGSRITKLKPRGGFCAETAAASSILISTFAGVGVSTTHVITGAIAGVGSIQRLKAVRWGVAANIVWAWVLTIPASAAVAAAAYFVKVITLNPNHADALLRLGNIYHKDGNYAEAVKLHTRAKNADENSVEAMFALALDYQDMRRQADALQTLEDILERDEGNLRALTRMRDIHQRSGNFEKAEETQERILKLDLPAKERDAEQARLVGLRYEVGRTLLEDGNLEKAKRIFKTCVKTDKNFVPAYLGLGEVYIEEGENQVAAELWEEAYAATGYARVAKTSRERMRIEGIVRRLRAEAGGGTK